MFYKLSALALFTPLVSALTLQAPTDPVVTGSSITVKWQSAQNDPDTWTIELHNPSQFRNDLAIANNVDPAPGSLTLTLPSVLPATGFTLIAVELGNITNVFASSPEFTIVANTASGSSSSSSTSSSGSGSGSSTSSSRSSSGTSSTASRSTSSTFGTTVSAPLSSSTHPASSGSSSGTGTQSAASNTTSTAGAIGLRVAAQGNVGTSLAVALSVIAGAALVAL